MRVKGRICSLGRLGRVGLRAKGLEIKGLGLKV